MAAFFSADVRTAPISTDAYTVGDVKSPVEPGFKVYFVYRDTGWVLERDFIVQVTAALTTLATLTATKATALIAAT